MHPNTFLRSFWSMTLRPQIFVAMSFDPAYNSRFKDVIEPVISALLYNGISMTACRVDLSKTGDSILTDISDGIAHSQFILADISTVGKDSVSGRPYRNGNVMYEVGIALAARPPTDVLLVRDDNDPLLFDVSVIPHAKIDFTNIDEAKAKLNSLLVDRLTEQGRVLNSRIELALAALSSEEISLINRFSHHPITTIWNYENKGVVNFEAQIAIPRLLDKGMIVLKGRFDNGNPAYGWTELGYIAAKIVKERLPEYTAEQPEKT